MKKYFYLTTLLVSGLIFGQKIEEKGLLWEISGNGMPNKSYLFGTMHIMCQGDVVLDSEVEEAIDNSRKVVLELDMGDPSVMMKMMQLSLATDGQTISDKLTPELAQKVDEYLKNNANMSLAMLENLNLVTLTMQLPIFALKCPIDLGYDMLFVQEALNREKEIVGLESLEDQIRIIFGMSDEEAIQALTYIVDNNDEMVEFMKEMREVYLGESVQALYDFTVESFNNPDYPQGDKEKMLDERNMNWIPAIESLIQENPVFIGVGAAHLAGEKGVINLLRQKGYQVEPIAREH